MKRLAIFASGGGSNARKIVEYFDNHSNIEVALIVSNKPKAGVLSLCDEYLIAKCVIERTTFYESEKILDILKKEKIDYIILAGFLWLIPEYLVKAFPDKIINIHPSLIPKFCGHKMYGHYVHDAVFAAKEKESGMTIHLVNEEFDKGKILFQAKCNIENAKNSEDIGALVLSLEHQHYAPTIEKYVESQDANYILPE